MTAYEHLLQRLPREPRTWLVTGCAGFIGSNLLEALLRLDQRVVGLGNFATGFRRNLGEVQSLVTAEQWAPFHFIEGDIRNPEDCRRSLEGVDHVLHQAALGSVPRSLADPLTTNATNITGFLNMLVAARDAKVRSFTYAASSATYGDHPALPKVEDQIGRPLSPYAVTKYVNELYADVFARNYAFPSIGLRYFNVFGPRQDPEGAYAAVIPKWTGGLLPCWRRPGTTLMKPIRTSACKRRDASSVRARARASAVREPQKDLLAEQVREDAAPDFVDALAGCRGQDVATQDPQRNPSIHGLVRDSQASLAGQQELVRGVVGKETQVRAVEDTGRLVREVSPHKAYSLPPAKHVRNRDQDLPTGLEQVGGCAQQNRGLAQVFQHVRKDDGIEAPLREFGGKARLEVADNHLIESAARHLSFALRDRESAHAGPRKACLDGSRVVAGATADVEHVLHRSSKQAKERLVSRVRVNTIFPARFDQLVEPFMGCFGTRRHSRGRTREVRRRSYALPLAAALEPGYSAS